MKSFSLGALNAEVVSDVDGQTFAQVDVRGTFVLTLTPSYSIDGINFFDLPVWNRGLETFAFSISNQTGFFSFEIPVGASKIRVRVTSFSSGSAIVALSSNRGVQMVYTKPIPTSLILSTATAIGTLNNPIITGLSGLFIYITKIIIEKHCGSALTPAATPIVVTTVGLSGNPSFGFKTLGPQGDSEIKELDFTSSPLKSSTIGTNVTIQCPATVGVIWRLQAFYYVG
ncbi:MAG: hypothetical protein ACEQSF_06055 [Solirubrobacteraceae bacterium]